MSESAQPRRPEHRVRVGRAPAPIAVTRAVETVRLAEAVAVLEEALAYADCSYDDRGYPVMSAREARERLRASLIGRLEKDARR